MAGERGGIHGKRKREGANYQLVQKKDYFKYGLRGRIRVSERKKKRPELRLKSGKNDIPQNSTMRRHAGGQGVMRKKATSCSITIKSLRDFVLS